MNFDKEPKADITYIPSHNANPINETLVMLVVLTDVDARFRGAYKFYTLENEGLDLIIGSN